jgi:hypothetical protein
MLLLYLLFFSRIRLLLRELRVFLLLLLLDSLPFLILLRAELILLLLVLPVQLGVSGGYNGPWRSRNLVRMDWRKRRGPIGLRRLRSVVRVYRTFRRAVSRTIWGQYNPVSGHWLMEESPTFTVALIEDFLKDRRPAAQQPIRSTGEQRVTPGEF